MTEARNTVTVQAITSFTGKYRWLSNFFPSSIEYEGQRYPTIEHAYQAAKTSDPSERAEILSTMQPAIAKRIGRRVTLKTDWYKARLSIMEQLLRLKFVPSSLFGDMLLSTGNAILIEGNYWGDTFWGVCRNKGHNHLGKILMHIRDDLRCK